MKNLKSLFVLLVAPLFFISVHADEPKVLQPFEVVPGTMIPLVLLNTDDLMVTAQVTTDVYDHYENVVIPKGSRLVGKKIRQVNDRHEVKWTGLQVPAAAGTLRLDPPLQATMPDGSAGLVNFQTAARAGAITDASFIVPH
jgi:type IV secretory pathway VirB10-like protein